MKRLLALLLLLAPISSWAACTVSTPGIDFGTFDFLRPAGLTAQAPLDIECDVPGPITVNLSHAQGLLQSTGMASLRSITGSGFFAHIYQDAARTQPWGSGSIAMTVPATFHGAFFANIQCADNGCTGVNYQANTYTDNVQIQVMAGGVPQSTTFMQVTATITPACLVDATDMQFPNSGDLSPESGFTGATAQSMITLTCNDYRDATVELTKSPMVRSNDPGTAITFDLYQDAALSLPWGTSSQALPVATNTRSYGQQIPVYGLIPPQPTVPSGTYQAPVRVDVAF